MKFIHPPIKKLEMSLYSKSLSFEEIMSNPKYSNETGTYIIGKNKMFHGGLNLTVPDKHAVQAVADGRIVAYRMMKNNEKLNLKGSTIEFSNCFILIEHDYQDLKYLKNYDVISQINDHYEWVEIDRTVESNHIMSDYKFYTLYMHLLPINDLSSKEVYPEWVYLNKTKEIILEKGHEILKDNYEIKNGIVLYSYNSKKIKFSEKCLVEINGNLYLNQNVSNSYVSDFSTNVSIICNQLVFLEKEEQINISGGDILGYGGLSQTTSLKEKYKNTLHFEVWLTNIEFMKNEMEALTSSYVTKIPDVFVSGRKEVEYNEKVDEFFSLPGLRALGYGYVENPIKTFENLYIHLVSGDLAYFIIKSENAKENFYLEMIPKGGIAPVIKSEQDFFKLYRKPIRIFSDADWFTKPVNKWLLKKQNTFFLNDGRFNYDYFKNNHNEWLKFNSRMVVELEYSEWDSSFFNKKYKFLLEKNEYYPKLDQIEFIFLQHYQKKLSFFDDLKKTKLNEKFKNIYIAHPINFLIDLSRCVIPAAPSTNPNIMKKIIQYSLDELFYLLENALKNLENWLLDDHFEIDKIFLKWFGYSKFYNNKFYEYKNIAHKDDITENIVPVFHNIFLNDYVDPVEIKDYKTAKRVLIENFRQSLRKLKKISINNFWYLAGRSQYIGASVTNMDLNLNINVGFASLTGLTIESRSNIKSRDNFEIPSFQRSDESEMLGFVMSILHETLHLPSLKKDIIDKEILPYLDSRNGITFSIRDVMGNVMYGKEPQIDLVAYGIENCLRLAELVPHIALVNSDNYAGFFSDLTDILGGRPKINYKQI